MVYRIAGENMICIIYPKRVSLIKTVVSSFIFKQLKKNRYERFKIKVQRD